MFLEFNRGPKFDVIVKSYLWSDRLGERNDLANQWVAALLPNNFNWIFWRLPNNFTWMFWRLPNNFTWMFWRLPNLAKCAFIIVILLCSAGMFLTANIMPPAAPPRPPPRPPRPRPPRSPRRLWSNLD